MTAKELFRGTKPFCMAKLALGAVTVLLSLLLFAILMGIGWLFGDLGMVITFGIWACGTAVIRLALMHYMGYMFKAGHIAVIAEAMMSGQLPPDQIEYGKAMVTERFVSSNVYFAVDKLVSAAIKEIQKGIDKVGGKLDFIPGMGAVTGLAKFFVDMALGYIDECCLGWTFCSGEQGAFKSAADAVVIYAQNWKVLLMNSAKTMGKVILALVLTTLAVFIPVGIVFKILKWSPLVAFLMSCLITWVVKFAFVDSYILCQMMVAYMQVAPNTVITFDLYGKLSRLSGSFKELWKKGQTESGGAAAAPATAPAEFVFCGQCGTKNKRGTRFCGGCGAAVGN